jgi:hypothetical protein
MDWIDIAVRVGVPVAILFAVGLGLWRAGSWLAVNAVLPIVASHQKYLETTATATETTAAAVVGMKTATETTAAAVVGMKTATETTAAAVVEIHRALPTTCKANCPTTECENFRPKKKPRSS